MNLEVVYVMKDFHGLFSAFLFLKRRKWHMYLEFLEFFKFTKFVTDLIFSESKRHIWLSIIFRLLSPKFAALWLWTNRFCFFCDLDIVGKKPKGRISKREFQVSKAQQIFRKRNVYYHLIRTRTYVRVRIREMFVFQNIWRALFSWNSRFEIRTFALLPTILRSIKHWSHETRIPIIQCFSHFSC